MKILKPGKVEQRKFVCPRCGCEFVASTADVVWRPYEYTETIPVVECPCGRVKYWAKGEPYEEPVQDTQDDRERLDTLICDLVNRETISRECIVDYLIKHGVTFREDCLYMSTDRENAAQRMVAIRQLLQTLAPVGSPPMGFGPLGI